MKPNKSSETLVGIIIDVILFVDLAIDLYTGKMSWTDLIEIMILTLLLTIPFVIIIRKIRKGRTCGSTKKNRAEDTTKDRG